MQALLSLEISMETPLAMPVGTFKAVVLVAVSGQNLVTGRLIFLTPIARLLTLSTSSNIRQSCDLLSACRPIVFIAGS